MKLLEVEEGHVPQCPIVGDATATHPFVAISGPKDRQRYVCDQIPRRRLPLNRISLSAASPRPVLSCALHCFRVRFCPPHANPPRSCTDAIDLTPTINLGPSCVNLTQHATGFPLSSAVVPQRKLIGPTKANPLIGTTVNLRSSDGHQAMDWEHVPKVWAGRYVYSSDFVPSKNGMIIWNFSVSILF